MYPSLNNNYDLNLLKKDSHIQKIPKYKIGKEMIGNINNNPGIISESYQKIAKKEEKNKSNKLLQKKRSSHEIRLDNQDEKSNTNKIKTVFEFDNILQNQEQKSKTNIINNKINSDDWLENQDEKPDTNINNKRINNIETSHKKEWKKINPETMLNDNKINIENNLKTSKFQNQNQNEAEQIQDNLWINSLNEYRLPKRFKDISFDNLKNK